MDAAMQAKILRVLQERVVTPVGGRPEPVDVRLANPAAPKRLSAEAAALLRDHGWPGNVRELRNAVERAAALSRGPTIESSDVAFLRHSVMPGPPASSDLTLPAAVMELERAMIRRALAEAGGSRTEAARKLGIHRQLLYDKMKRHGLGEGG